MNDRTGTTAGPEPGPEPGPVSVPAAAQALGISERAVRKRIHAGTLRGEPFGRSFMVWLPDDAPPPGPEPGPAPRPEPGPEPIEARFTADTALVSDAARQQLAAIRDEWLAPLVAQLTEQAETIGRLTAERDELRERLAAAEAEKVAPAPPQPRSAEEAPPAPDSAPVAPGGVQGFWARVRRVLGGE